MKKLITTALLLARLTVSAQNIDSKYFTVDTTIENGIDYVPHFEALFVDQESRKDSILIYPQISKYVDKGFVLEGFFLIFLNDNQYVNKIHFDFENKNIKLVNLRTYFYAESDKVHFLTSKKDIKPELFADMINKVEFNDKTYVPTSNSDVYFVYMIGVFNDLKSNWIKEKY